MRKRIFVTVTVLTMLLGLFGCGSKNQVAVASVEEMTLTLRGMRGGWVYQFENNEEKTELRLCREVYAGEECELVPEQSMLCDPQTMVDLMNTCGIVRWDGFYGKRPNNVLDGVTFRFEAKVNGQRTITAEGSENFPKGYLAFLRSLDEMLAENEQN